LPTWSAVESFYRDLADLTPTERKAFRRAVANFVADLKRGAFRKGLRIKGVQGTDGIFEMTWAEDGRATFEYGPQVRPKQKHIVWRRVGSHAIFRSP
jgi:hypothetical protein